MSQHNSDRREQQKLGVVKHNAAVRATGEPINFKYGVYGVGETRMTFNACTFATADEADRAGFELQMRWMGMEGFDTVETNEPVTYTFPESASRPLSIPMADRTT